MWYQVISPREVSSLGWQLSMFASYEDNTSVLIDCYLEQQSK
jgi:hypothetical protein